nr:MAG TPA: hypothetical protein [Caudoviricetes sp.]
MCFLILSLGSARSAKIGRFLHFFVANLLLFTSTYHKI